MVWYLLGISDSIADWKKKWFLATVPDHVRKLKCKRNHTVLKPTDFMTPNCHH